MTDMRTNISREEMLRDLEWTRQDCLRLDGIVTNLRLFIKDAGEEDRSSSRMDLYKYESLLNQAVRLRETITQRVNQSDKNFTKLNS